MGEGDGRRRAARLGPALALITLPLLGLSLVAPPSLAPFSVAYAGPFSPDDTPEYRELPACATPDENAVCFDFEGPGPVDWQSPDWFAGKARLVPCTVDLVQRPDAAGQALAMDFAVPDQPWCAAGIRLGGPCDLIPYGELTADLYLPREIPGHGVAVRLILRAGKSWTWYQMRDAVTLTPGRWTTLRVPLAARLIDDPESRAWGDGTARLPADQGLVQEMLIRVEVSAAEGATAEAGRVLIDDIRLVP